MSSGTGPKRAASSPPSAITLSSDSDGELPITQQSHKRPKKKLPATSALPTPSATLDPQPSAGPSSSQGPTRAQLEADRLARQQARQADPTRPGPSYTVRPAPNPTNVATINSIQSGSPPASSVSGSGKGKGVATFASLSHQGRANHELRFWKGAVKRVPNKFR